jgi:hypothetical protein
MSKRGIFTHNRLDRFFYRPDSTTGRVLRQRGGGANSSLIDSVDHNTPRPDNRPTFSEKTFIRIYDSQFFIESKIFAIILAALR